ncbi:hypothetical protein Nepgr_026936 [Nepenthes gracilis]|uniref:C2H2-type domain-containing protein n=1 Tax=Nepenthes gracilis TaxID=150966 RepID=A0AAD3Y113_NEPGR|nr:hypothetical protein Nepgr_026936 [Nepenthes gracilis]
MAAASPTTAEVAVVGFFRDENQAKQRHSTAADPTSSSAPLPKKKRNLPGTPNPGAEVIALSPKTLMATNRFICEVCNKGFQREQNLQLHRRGHNLPWKLRQKNTNDQAAVRKKVYLCPEPTCLHHDPARALGDLTGIKKHYSRKHGEKKFKCEKCSKRYAVQSDWKAHSKTCGTREYRCDCGTLFSRRDSFITHRAFCDALAQENAGHPTSFSTVASHLLGGNTTGIGLGISRDTNHTTTTDILQLGRSNASRRQFEHDLTPPWSLSSAFRSPPQPPLAPPSAAPADFYVSESSNQPYSITLNHEAQMQHLSADLQNNPINNPSSFFNLGGFSNYPTTNNNLASSTFLLSTQFNTDNYNGAGNGNNGDDSSSNLFSGLVVPSLYGSPSQQQHSNRICQHMSATALLQKAAQMGSTSSSLNHPAASSLLRGYRLSSFSGSGICNANGLTRSDIEVAPPLGFGSMLGVGKSDHDQNEGSYLHHLMSSLSGENSPSLFDFNSSYIASNNDYAGSNSKGNFAASDRLTRDFLGVGEIVRSMSKTTSGQQQRELEDGGIGIMSNCIMDSEKKATAPITQSFSSRNFK